MDRLRQSRVLSWTATRRARLGLAALVAALAVAVPVAWAGHFFVDVPDTNPHHDDIEAIKDAGITAGCNPPANDAYCPDQAVRRDQMASFLRRGLGRAAFADFQAAPTPTSYVMPVGSVTITPGVPANALAGAAGFVLANAQVTIFVSDAGGCPCDFMADLGSDEADWLTPSSGRVTANDVGYYTLALTGAARFEGAGEREIEVFVARVSGTGTSEVEGQVSAHYLPFGSTGANTLEIPQRQKAIGGLPTPRPGE